jgi:UDP-glucose 4-epimerase
MDNGKNGGSGDKLDTAGAVLITGICGRLGQLFARHLHRTDRVIGVDSKPFEGKPADIVHYQLDLRQKRLREVFSNNSIRAVVHLGVAHEVWRRNSRRYSWNIAGFENLLEQIDLFQIPKLVLLSSATIYGPRPENPHYLSEDAPLLGAENFSELRDLIQVDMIGQKFFWQKLEIETVILRPCHILGKVNNAPSKFLRLERPFTLAGFDPPVQFIHERDLVNALGLALPRGVRGVFNLGGSAELNLSKVFQILGKKTISLPGFVAKGVVKSFWSSGAASYHPGEIEYLQYICMVDDTRARAKLGYTPTFSLEDTLKAVFDEF